MTCRSLLRILVVVLFAAASLWSQTGAGSISGTITDPSGGVVPQAKVQATQTATGIVSSTQSNGAGFFVFPSLPIGNYKVRVEAAGMRPWEAELVLQVRQSAVLSPALAVAGTATEVTVAGDVTALVALDNATLGSVVERSRIEQLPLDGRMIYTLVQLTTPGLEGGAAFNPWGATMEFVQDGAVLADRDPSGTYQRPPSLDTVAEYKVETNNSSAKMNRPATVILSTRSGTNELHGSAFETARNSGLGVARARQDTFTKPPHLVRNEFGASLGGPVYLPRFYNGRQRTFFFFSYEAFRLMSGVTRPTSVPTEAMRQGDFSGLINGLGQKITIYDPLSTNPTTFARQPFPNNKIPISRLSPLAKYIYSVTPLPTLPEVNPLLGSNFYGPGPNEQRQYTITSRVDHVFSERDQVFGRFTRGMRMGTGPATGTQGPPTLDNSTNRTYATMPNYSLAVSWIHNFSPTFFSETLFSTSFEDYNVYTGDFFKDWSGQLGLPNPYKRQGFPNLYSTGFGMTYIQGDTQRDAKTWIPVFDQNFTKVAGRHELQFGGRFRYDRGHVLPDQNANAVYYSSQGTALYDPKSTPTNPLITALTGSNAADFFLGTAYGYVVQFTQGTYRIREQEYAGYFQDNWKVTPRLTLNLGLRYEFHPPLHERDGLFNSFDTANHAIVLGPAMQKLFDLGRTTPAIVANYQKIGVKFETAKEAGLPTSIILPDYRNFNPRLGFAYKAIEGRHPLVVRSGFAIFSYNPPWRNWDSPMRGTPPFNASFTRSLVDPAQSPDGIGSYLLRSVPTVIAGQNSSDAVDIGSPNAVTRGSWGTLFFDPNQPLSRVGEWNFTLEREVMDNTVARIAYVGQHGWNQEQEFNLNPNPVTDYVWYTKTGLAKPTGIYASTGMRPYDATTYGDLWQYGKYGWMNTNAFTFEIKRRYSKGYAFQLFYVLMNAFRVGGNAWRDQIVPDASAYLPGAVPSDVNERNRFLNYGRATQLPKHHIRGNWLVDLPFGRGRLLAKNANRFVDALIGGWQLAGDLNIFSSYTSLPAGYWNFGNVEVYGKKYPIQDCRSGRCYAGYLYFNGYIPANRINSFDANGKPNGVMGVPSNYKPAAWPLIPVPAQPVAGDPNAPYYDSNTVWVTLKDGTVQRTNYDTGLNPWRNQFLMGVFNQVVNASLFKQFAINERFNLRVNADFFNVFNMPGLTQANSTSGIISLQNSNNAPRNMQLSLRLSF